MCVGMDTLVAYPKSQVCPPMSAPLALAHCPKKIPLPNLSIYRYLSLYIYIFTILSVNLSIPSAA